jgi:hypothetical protein
MKTIIFKSIMVVFMFFKLSFQVQAQFATLPSNVVFNSWLSNPFGHVNPTTLFPTPSNSAQMIPLSDVKYNYILTLNDLLNAGILPNAVISSIGYNFFSGYGLPYPDLTISLKHTNANTLNTFDNNNLTLVYSGNFNLPGIGWQQIPFTNSFTWNGTQNILVSICWNRSFAAWGAPVSHSDTYLLGRGICNQAQSGNGCNLIANSQSTLVPITRFGFGPIINSINPQSACNDQNTLITLNGYFVGINSVTIGGNPVPFTLINQNELVINNNSSSSGLISVTNSAGTAVSQVSFNSIPLPNPPSLPVSNSPQCSTVIIYPLTPPNGVEYYWQDIVNNGTSTITNSLNPISISNSGTYYIRALNTSGCWSSNSTNIDITVLNPSNSSLSVSECGSYFAPNGTQYTSSGQYQSIIPNAAGCDSTININLTINPEFSVTDTVFACQNYTWIDGVTYNASNYSASYTLATSSGCDSIIYLNLYLGQPSLDTTFIQISAINSYELNGSIYTENGQYYQTITDQFGCDSTISIELFLEYLTTIETEKGSVRIYPIPSNDGIFYISGEGINIISLTDILGNNIDFRRSNDTVNLCNYSKGTYFLHLKVNEQIILLKLIYL